MKRVGYYFLEMFKSKKVYVGSTSDFDKRSERHFLDLRHDRHHNQNIQKEYNSGSAATFYFFPTESREEAYEKEKFFIDKFLEEGKCLNIGLDVIGGDNLSNNPNREIIISKIKKAVVLRNQLLSESERKRLYGKVGELNPMFSKHHTDETKSKIRARLNTPENKILFRNLHLGKKRSLETRKKISLSASKRVGSLNPFFGRNHTDESKKLISDSRIGIKPSNVRKVSINGEVFPSVSDAARNIGCCNASIIFRIKSNNPKFSDYKYLDD